MFKFFNLTSPNPPINPLMQVENDTEKLKRLSDACVVADREYNEFAQELIDNAQELIDKIKKSRESRDETDNLKDDSHISSTQPELAVDQPVPEPPKRGEATLNNKSGHEWFNGTSWGLK